MTKSLHKDRISFEIKRKLFHISAVIIPLFYLYIDKISMCLLITLVTIVTISLDYYKNQNSKIRNIIYLLFTQVMRDEEKNTDIKIYQFSGASYMATGLMLSCILFDKYLAITSWMILIISDSAAAIIGIKYGKNFIVSSKTFEGSITFFITSLIIGFLCNILFAQEISLLIIVVASIVTTIVELYTNRLRINDNLSIPISYGFTILLLSQLSLL